MSDINMKFVTSEERYKVLETRDNYIRKMNKEKFNHYKDSTIQGTCLDMCPEKERYFREYLNKLSSFECDEYDNFEHKLYIKEYTRSSADQEEPVESDLRSSDVLVYTTKFMLNHMIGENNCVTIQAYHFIWSRMRGMVKDITQQRLCSLECVFVLECCSRWLIFCSFYFCEKSQTSRNFDSKLNFDNLMKCMVPLQGMYQDLRLFHNTTCSNESEFLAYFILLNLKDGSIDKKIAKMPAHLLDCQHVVFALNAYVCLSNNAYSSFFKLVKSCTFLQACLLFRYFQEMRFVGIIKMAAAFKNSLSNNAFPISYIVNKFLFEDLQHAKDFLHLFNFPCDDNLVYFNKAKEINNNNPTSSLKREKCIEDILLQGDVYLKDIIAGSPLSYTEVKEVQCISFDSEGYYIGSPSLDVFYDTTHTQDFKQSTDPLEIKEMPIDKSIFDDKSHRIYSFIIKEIIYEISEAESRNCISDMKAEGVLASLLNHHLDIVINSIVLNQLRERKIEEYSNDIYDVLENDLISQFLKQNVNQIIKQKIEEESFRLKERVATSFDSLIMSVVDDKILQLVKDSLSLEKEKIKFQEDIKIKREFFHLWLKNAKRQKSEKLALYSLRFKPLKRNKSYHSLNKKHPSCVYLERTLLM